MKKSIYLVTISMLLIYLSGCGNNYNKEFDREEELNIGMQEEFEKNIDIIK